MDQPVTWCYPCVLSQHRMNLDALKFSRCICINLHIVYQILKGTSYNRCFLFFSLLIEINSFIEHKIHLGCKIGMPSPCPLCITSATVMSKGHRFSSRKEHSFYSIYTPIITIESVLWNKISLYCQVVLALIRIFRQNLQKVADLSCIDEVLLKRCLFSILLGEIFIAYLLGNWLMLFVSHWCILKAMIQWK